MPDDSIPGIIRDVEQLQADVHAIRERLESAREGLAALRGEVRIIIALLVLNGGLNIASLLSPHN